ncbi:MAG: helix-turn-helix transcriptional regulator [Candidatus Margulisbacteria bacterium]|jgi:transcriptional regulator with XRE-family HTH domain|nr:helix-turn-helix transcriptional regulator [Candidatus Margulisiibacteriota bacterium]
MIEHRDALALLAVKIKKLRERQALTLEKLAYENDISKGNLSDIENIKRSPSLATLIKIANGLDCRVRDLFDF